MRIEKSDMRDPSHSRTVFDAGFVYIAKKGMPFPSGQAVILVFQRHRLGAPARNVATTPKGAAMSTHPQSVLRLALLFTLLALLASIVFVAPAANARPVLPKFVGMEDGPATPRHDERAPLFPRGVFGAADQGTTWFGGTVWAADSMRWEAIEGGVWTFDSGVGSHFDHSAPYVNPYKDPSLHAYMEGWVGIDNTYSEIPYFRRLSEADFAAESVAPCVGSATGLGGSWSMWAGVLPSEADELCYAAGMGYGNSWNVCIERQFTLSTVENVTLEYDYRNDTEAGWDYTYVIVDRDNSGDEVGLTSYTGVVSGTDTFVLEPGPTLRNTAGPFAIRFCAVSDGAYSDEDGLYTTDCGMFAVDDISVTGGGINHTATFETGDDGWTLSPARPGAGGDWSDIVDMADLPPIPPIYCPDYNTCGVEDSVLAFADWTVGSGGHGFYQDNMAASPWIDLREAGVVGKPGKMLEFHMYAELPLINYVFLQENVQWYPQICPETGKPVVSDWTSNGFVTNWWTPSCRGPDNPVNLDFSDVIDLDAEQVRVALGVINYCRYYANCSGTTNTTPWYDNVRFGVYGHPTAPYITASTIDTPQDAFPEDGTLDIDAPGRVDCNNVKSNQVPEPFTSLGDTLVVSGASGGSEVYVVFSVDPGPGIDQPRFTSWLTSHTPAGPWRGTDWYQARIDTAEVNGVLQTGGTWMTTYHETEANFTGNDRDLDPTDLDPNGGMTRLANDIFPDDLFTPGTRLMLYYKTRFTGGTDWFTLPDTSGGGYMEMEVMPSSMAADSTFNCLLYVDHYDGRGAQPLIEPALRSVVAGGSANFEDTPWDRWDVRAPSSGQGSFGREINTFYGATLTQALGYRMILWNSGNLNATNVSQEDASVLVPWLNLSVPGTGPRGLYLSGDGLAESIVTEAQRAPTALQLLQDYCGVDLVCGRVGDANCPAGTMSDTTSCVDLDPVGSARVAGAIGGGRTDQHQGQGSGCPQYRSFDVLGLRTGAQGMPAGDENYGSPITGTASYASVTNQVSGGPDYKTVVDGVSIHYRRDPSDCRYTTGNSVEPAIEQRLREVLDWFGGLSAEPCADLSGIVAVPDARPPVRPVLGLRLLTANPVVGAARAEFELTVPSGQAARLQVFDVAGRLVRTLHDGPAESETLRVSWDRTDTTGRRVPSGIYFIRLAGETVIAKRLVVIR